MAGRGQLPRASGRAGFWKTERGGKHAHPAAPAVCPAAQSAPHVRTRGADKILKTLVCRAHGRAHGRTKLPKIPRIPDAWPGAGSSPRASGRAGFWKTERRRIAREPRYETVPGALRHAAQSAPHVRARGILENGAGRKTCASRRARRLPRSAKRPARQTRGADKILKTLVCRAHGRARAAPPRVRTYGVLKNETGRKTCASRHARRAPQRKAPRTSDVRGGQNSQKAHVCRAHGRAHGRTKLPKSPRIPDA